MADTKISAETAASALGGTEAIPCVQGGANRRLTPAQIFTYIRGAGLDADLWGKHTVWVPAAAMRPSVSGGCAPLALVAISAGQPDLSTLDFDAATDESAQFWVAMPKSWDEGPVTAQFLWSHATTTTTFAVIWGIQAVAFGDSDAMGASFGTAVTVTDTGGTTNDLWLSPETGAVTIAGTPTEGDAVCFKVYRDADAGGDTMAVDARLHGVRLYYTTNAGTDA
jgi:hypothetical protein